MAEPISFALLGVGLYMLSKGVSNAKKNSTGTTGSELENELPGGASGAFYDKSQYGVKDAKGGCNVPIITPNGTIQPFYVVNCPALNADELKIVGTGGELYEVQEDEQGTLVVIQTGGATLPVDEFWGVFIILNKDEYDIVNTFGLGEYVNIYPPTWKFTPNVSFGNLRNNTILLAGVSNEANQSMVMSFFKGLNINPDIDYTAATVPTKQLTKAGNELYLPLRPEFKETFKSLWFEFNKIGVLIPDFGNAEKGYLYKYLKTPLPNSQNIIFKEN